MNNLYKVKVETDLMVVASSQEDAISIGISAAPSEMAVYGKGLAVAVNHISEIPEDWKSVIPYSKEKETKKCYEIVSSFYDESKKEIAEEDIQEIIKIKENSKSIPREIVPETRPDPKPRELQWNETKSGRPLPILRYKI